MGGVVGDLLGSLDAWAVWLVSVAAAVAVLAGFVRWLRPRWRKARQKWEDFETAVLGRDAIIHPDTGHELAPAVPGIGARQAHIETQMGTLAEAVAQIADTSGRVNALEGRVTALERKEIERILARTESIEMFRTIDSAIQSDPNPPKGDQS